MKVCKKNEAALVVEDVILDTGSVSLYIHLASAFKATAWI